MGRTGRGSQEPTGTSMVVVDTKSLANLVVHQIEAFLLGCVGATRFNLSEGVGQDRLLLGDEIEKRLVDAGIEDRCLVLF